MVLCSYNVHVHIFNEAYLFIFPQSVVIRLGCRKFYGRKYGSSSPKHCLRRAMPRNMPLHFYFEIGMKSMLPHSCSMKLVQSPGIPLQPDRAKYEQVQPLQAISNQLIPCTGHRSSQTSSHDPYKEIYDDTWSCLGLTLTSFLQISNLVCHFGGVKLNPITRCWMCLQLPPSLHNMPLYPL